MNIKKVTGHMEEVSGHTEKVTSPTENRTGPMKKGTGPMNGDQSSFPYVTWKYAVFNNLTQRTPL